MAENGERPAEERAEEPPVPAQGQQAAPEPAPEPELDPEPIIIPVAVLLNPQDVAIAQQMFANANPGGPQNGAAAPAEVARAARPRGRPPIPRRGRHTLHAPRPAIPENPQSEGVGRRTPRHLMPTRPGEYPSEVVLPQAQRPLHEPGTSRPKSVLTEQNPDPLPVPQAPGGGEGLDLSQARGDALRRPPRDDDDEPPAAAV